MAYYVSQEGDDSNSARSLEEAVRSLTRVLEVIALDYPDGVSIPQVVRVAPGTYSASFGERFPIIVPIDVHVMGGGRDVCVLEYGSVWGCQNLELPIPVAVDLRGTLSGMSVVNTELDENYPTYAATDIDVRDWSAIVESVSCNLIHVSAANLLSDVVSCVMTVYQSRRQDDELLPLIQQCNCLACGGGGSFFWLFGGHLRRCIGNVNVYAPSDTVVEDCELLHVYVFKADLDELPSSLGTPHFINNVIGQHGGFYTEEPPMVWGGLVIVEADSRWEGNTIRVHFMEVTSNATFVDNPTILTENAFHICRHEDSSGDGPLVPEFYRNTFEQPINSRDAVYEENVCDEEGNVVEPKWMYLHLIRVMDDAAPLFEGNVFRSCGSDYSYCLAGPDITMMVNPYSALWIEDNANPDLGGGERGSQGQNVFEMGFRYTVHRAGEEPERGDVYHVHIDIGDRSLTLHASNNTWNTEPRIHVVSGTDVSWDVEPYRIGGTI